MITRHRFPESSCVRANTAPRARGRRLGISPDSVFPSRRLSSIRAIALILRRSSEGGGLLSAPAAHRFPIDSKTGPRAR